MTDNRPQERNESPPDPHGDPARWAPRLERILDQQDALYSELDELGQRQSELIQRGETEELLDVLGTRQRVIDQLGAAMEAFQPFGRRWDELMASLPEDRRQRYAQRVEELSGVIRRIADRDQEDQRALERQRAVVADEMASVSRGRSAVAAYGGNRRTSDGPTYQDRQA